jgi:hypothetical protein
MFHEAPVRGFATGAAARAWVSKAGPATTTLLAPGRIAERTKAPVLKTALIHGAM